MLKGQCVRLLFYRYMFVCFFNFLTAFSLFGQRRGCTYIKAGYIPLGRLASSSQGLCEHLCVQYLTQGCFADSVLTSPYYQNTLRVLSGAWTENPPIRNPVSKLPLPKLAFLIFLLSLCICFVCITFIYCFNNLMVCLPLSGMLWVCVPYQVFCYYNTNTYYLLCMMQFIKVIFSESIIQ